eukprot:3902152-Pleurochrysis_carterae.AAC.2
MARCRLHAYSGHEGQHAYSVSSLRVAPIRSAVASCKGDANKGVPPRPVWLKEGRPVLAQARKERRKHEAASSVCALDSRGAWPWCKTAAYCRTTRARLPRARPSALLHPISPLSRGSPCMHPRRAGPSRRLAIGLAWRA